MDKNLSPPVQGTQVQALVQEDSICLGATKPQSHNYRAHVPQLLKPGHPRPCAPQEEKPPQQEARTPQLEKAQAKHGRPGTAKNSYMNFKTH